MKRQGHDLMPWLINIGTAAIFTTWAIRTYEPVVIAFAAVFWISLIGNLVIHHTRFLQRRGS